MIRTETINMTPNATLSAVREDVLNEVIFTCRKHKGFNALRRVPVLLIFHVTGGNSHFDLDSPRCCGVERIRAERSAATNLTEIDYEVFYLLGFEDYKVPIKFGWE